MEKPAHPSDQELLQSADGELSARQAAQVRAHLTACWNCRTRLAEIEEAVVQFTRAHQQASAATLPSIAGPRSLLRAKLAGLTAERQSRSWRTFFQFAWHIRDIALVCVAVFIAVMASRMFLPHGNGHTRSADSTSFDRADVPDSKLTPGATKPFAVGDVCSMAHEDVVALVPAPLRQQVLSEYGIANEHASDYEIDYLIAPGLGGAQDIRNLWPEPNKSPMWSAPVKDTLEERLHQLVCGGKVSLRTAQHDIATDWIGAYKKYFQTESPLLQNTRFEHISALESVWIYPGSRNFE